MKIIDDKGRLLGRINIFDFLALCFVLAAVPFAIFVSGFYKHKKALEPVSAKRIVEVTLDCCFLAVNPEVLGSMRVGDSEKDDSGRNIVEITAIGEPLAHYNVYPVGSGKTISIEDPLLKQVPVTMKIRAFYAGDSLYYKDQPINVNSTFSFDAEKYRLSVKPVIKGPAEVVERTGYLDFTVALKDLDEKTCGLISAGDHQGDDAQIINVIKISKNSRSVNISDHIIEAEDADRNEAVVKMRLKCELRKNGEIYFRREKITRDYPINFVTDKYAAKAHILRKPIEADNVYREKWVGLTIRFPEVIPEVAEVIRSGDFDTSMIGQKIAILRKVLKKEPSKAVRIESNGTVMNDKKLASEIEAYFDMLCLEKDNMLLFKNDTVRMGSNISFTTDLYTIRGIITGLNKKE